MNRENSEDELSDDDDEYSDEDGVDGEDDEDDDGAIEGPKAEEEVFLGQHYRKYHSLS